MGKVFMADNKKLITVSIVVDEVKAILVEQGRKVRLSHSQPDSICKSLTKGTSSNLDACKCFRDQVRCATRANAQKLTISVSGLWVTRRLRVYLTEGFKVVYGELIAQEVKENVLESTSEMMDSE